MAERQIRVPEHLRSSHPHCFALEVNGACMEPAIPNGSIVVVDPDVQPVGDGTDTAVLEVDGLLYLCRPFDVFDQVVMLHDNPVHLNPAFEKKYVKTTGAVVWVYVQGCAGLN